MLFNKTKYLNLFFLGRKALKIKSNPSNSLEAVQVQADIRGKTKSNPSNSPEAVQVQAGIRGKTKSNQIQGTVYRQSKFKRACPLLDRLRSVSRIVVAATQSCSGF